MGSIGRRSCRVCSVVSPGETQVRLRLEAARDFSLVLDVPAKVRLDKEFKAEIVRICGPDMMEVLGN